MENSLCKEVNSKILKIWNKYIIKMNIEDKVYIPLLYHTKSLKKNTCLIIGLNPSFSIKGFKSYLKDKQELPSNEDEIKKIHLWKNRCEENYQLAIKMHKIAVEEYSYFKKFDILLEKVDLEWIHIDLFFYRITGQKKLKNIVLKNKNNFELNEFGIEQFKLTRKMIIRLNPKMILIQNALASKIFDKYWNEDFKYKFPTEKGYNIVRIDGRKIPIFFSGMLTGQRALDNFSFDRLRWLMKKAYKENNL